MTRYVNAYGVYEGRGGGRGIGGGGGGDMRSGGHGGEEFTLVEITGRFGRRRRGGWRASAYKC